MKTVVLRCASALIVIVLSACGGTVDSSSEDSGTAPETTAAAMVDTDMDGMSDEEMSGHEHEHGDELAEVTWTPVPAIELTLTDDGDGWVGSIDVADFELTEGEVDPEPVDGQGHAHLYIDGVKNRRLYETTFTIDPLDPGTHEIRVELVGNDHVTLATDGTAIGASTTVAVEGEVVDDADRAADADQVIEVTVADGSVEVAGGSKEVAVELGSSVAILVTSDIAEEVHVHGYDVFADLVPGETATLTFDANIPGGFEVELEGRGQLLVDLVVS